MPIDAPPPPEIVVTGPARLPEAAGDPAFSIIKLGPAQIDASPRLDEVLAQVPGLTLYRRTSSLSNNPTTQGISLRDIAGSAASRSLVTLDGAPRNDPFGGWVIWSGIAPDTIDAITVVRGAGAGPYGAGALTGTVDLAGRVSVPGGLTADGSVGGLNDRQGEAFASADFAGAKAFAAVSGERTSGFVPVRQGRGPADRPLTLDDWAGATGATTQTGVGDLTARLSGYQEDRGSGLIGAESRARGGQASLTLAQAPTASALGYRLQAWATQSDLLNTSVSVAANRLTTTPADDQYATPAAGYGANAALRWAGGADSLELGADIRGAEGESRENLKYVAGAFTVNRRSGGETLTGGVYLEGAHKDGPWLLAGGLRLDGWQDYDSHRIERQIVSGAVTLNAHYPRAGGTEPTGRIALRRNLSDGLFVRSAAYAGFRPVTLNELDRTFRVGNDVTEANPALQPEKLLGAEAGIGQDRAGWSWQATAFFNRLNDAVINATQHVGPYTDPVEGFIPAGGTLYRRENVDHIDAAGVEAEARRAFGPVNLTLSADYTRAVVDGGSTAPQLTGKAPAETPRFTAVAAADWRATSRLRLSVNARYETKRYDDDLNTRPLRDGAVFNAKAEYRLKAGLGAFLAIDNLADAALQTGRTAAGAGVPSVVSYDAPRMVRVGLTFRE
jgi:outer membrane receptor protein involved in Fe transport